MAGSRRKKINEADGLSFVKKLLEMTDKFPDPEPEELGVMVHVNSHGVPYPECHFRETFRDFVFINRMPVIKTIIQCCEVLAGLKVDPKIDRRGVFFMREAFMAYLRERPDAAVADTPFSAFPPATISSWLIVEVYEPWRQYRSGDWADRKGRAYYEECCPKVDPRDVYAMS